MARISHIVFPTMMLILGLQTTTGFHIQISPHRYTEESTGSVEIACVLDALDHCLHKGVVILELKRDEVIPVASVRPRSGVDFGTEYLKNYGGQGAVDPQRNRTFLNVSLLVPGNDDTGRYTCSLSYVNEDGKLMEDHDSKNLTVEIYSVHTALKTIMTTVSLLQNELMTKDSQLEELRERNFNQTQQMAHKDSQLEELKDRNYNLSLQLENKGIQSEPSFLNQSQLIAEIARKGTSDIVFSARFKSDVKVPGATLVFGDVLINKGKAYDGSSGIFTVPRNGLYAFQVSMYSRCHVCWTRFHIYINGGSMIELDAYDPAVSEQASAQVTKELDKGTKILVSGHGDKTKGKFYRSTNHKESLFSGYLIKAF